MFSRLKSKNIIRICFLFLAAFFVGTGAAFLHDHFFPAAVPTSSEGNWGLSFQTDGDPPVGNATFDELKKFDAFYAQDTGEKVIYLTFDAGYENGNTPAILEALTKHQAPATFFVVGTLLESNPELIKQILAAGNTILNSRATARIAPQTIATRPRPKMDVWCSSTRFLIWRTWPLRLRRRMA